MNAREPSDKAARQIKRTEILFLIFGLLVAASGVMFAVVHHRYGWLRTNVQTAAILVGIGSLAGCIYQTYVRLARIEEKIDKLSASIDTENRETEKEN
jgi:hypothetical protein